MDVRQLRCFVAVAEELHFGRAAARLHVAQPAVSQTVKGVERELGLALFDRTNRRVVLTHAGEVLLAEARAVLERLDSALEAMARLRTGQVGHVTIGAVPALPPQLVPRVLAHLAFELPSVSVVVRAIGPGVQAADGLDGGFDLVLLRGEVGSPGLSTAVVARELIGVALPARHPLAVEEVVAPADLSGQAFVSFPRSHQPDEYDRLFGALVGAGFRGAGMVHESAPGAVDASLRLVAGGSAVSLKLASEVSAFASDEVVWRPLAGVVLEAVVSAAWRPDRATPALCRLVELLPGPP